jgi:hypothetical protein
MFRDLKKLLSAILGTPVIGDVIGPGLAGVAAFGLMLGCESFRQVQQMNADNKAANKFNETSNAILQSEHVNGDLSAPLIKNLPSFAHKAD